MHLHLYLVRFYVQALFHHAEGFPEIPSGFEQSADVVERVQVQRLVFRFPNVLMGQHRPPLYQGLVAAPLPLQVGAEVEPGLQEVGVEGQRPAAHGLGPGKLPVRRQHLRVVEVHHVGGPGARVIYPGGEQFLDRCGFPRLGQALGNGQQIEQRQGIRPGERQCGLLDPRQVRAPNCPQFFFYFQMHRLLQTRQGV